MVIKNFERAVMTSAWKEPKELEIPIPYGHISAKLWGEEHHEPVLALHGWQDNAGTFDKLIPLLTPNLKIVAFDAPGHGLSSHKPVGAFYPYMEMLIDIKRVVDYLKWDTFNFIGHSLGGTLALMYCSIFPEAVKNIILLDIIKPASRLPELLPAVVQNGVETLLSLERKMCGSAPLYSLDEARTRLVTGMVNEITPEAADTLLKRGSIPSSCGKGITFSKDIRIKGTGHFQKLSHNSLKAYLKRVKCNLLIIIGDKSFISQSRTPEVLNEFIDIFKENCLSFKMIKVDGNHFVHLNDPEVVAPIVNAFFDKHLRKVLSSKL